ncbi:MAG: NAD-dependent isocitrate dehydrogenase, partial [Acidobacteria bacterium]|nr:NAD-dependent isocitrate dehydrogenase [Acidobacteriota bacterium]
MTHRLTLIPGDGIGPEVTEAVVRIIKASGVKIDWDKHDAGVAAFQRTGSSLPKDLLDSILANKVGLKGPVT